MKGKCFSHIIPFHKT